jgi:hypothetical protein
MNIWIRVLLTLVALNICASALFLPEIACVLVAIITLFIIFAIWN